MANKQNEEEMKVRFTTYTRENADLMERRIKTSKKVNGYEVEANGFEFVVDFQRGAGFGEMQKIANGQTMTIAE